MTWDRMFDAPKNGDIIEGLFESEWLRVYWSDSAYDGSDYGVEGWAQVDGGHLILDLEGWREISTEECIVPEGWTSPLPGHKFGQPIIVLGLGFGDEAKGATVDYLASTIPDVNAVVRWSGGANAAHNIRHGHRHHTFRQFGSGTLLGVPTFLNQNVLVNPQVLIAEAVELESKGVHNPLALLTIHPRCKVVTPIMVAINRAREILRGSERHGSCGMGIGETIVHSYARKAGLEFLDVVGNFEVAGPIVGTERSLVMSELKYSSSVEELTTHILEYLKAEAIYAERILNEARAFAPFLAEELEYGNLEEIAVEYAELGLTLGQNIPTVAGFDQQMTDLMESGTVIFEGSQGLLLDETQGFHPHTTWATTAPHNLVHEIEKKNFTPYILGLTRSYMTRHGAGPLPAESSAFSTEVSLPADDNGWGRYQGSFRVCPLDLPLLGYSQRIIRRPYYSTKLDGIAVSHMDLFEGDPNKKIPVIVGYDGDKNPADSWWIQYSRDGYFVTGDSLDHLERTMIGSERDEVQMNAGELIESIERVLKAPVVLLADGNMRNNRSYRV